VHFRVILFLLNDRTEDFVKYRSGGFQKKTNSNIYYSNADTFIQMLWKMAYDSKDITNFKNASEIWQDNFICDIRPMDSEKGIYEVFKYCFKDIDIKNFEIFKFLYIGLKSKRLRQGYCKLYNLKFDDRALDD
jgi:plasmid rolling circle replication initiator protein Rep